MAHLLREHVVNARVVVEFEPYRFAHEDLFLDIEGRNPVPFLLRQFPAGGKFLHENARVDVLLPDFEHFAAAEAGNAVYAEQQRGQHDEMRHGLMHQLVQGGWIGAVFRHEIDCGFLRQAEFVYSGSPLQVPRPPDADKSS